jgi:hypothetical protein
MRRRLQFTQNNKKQGTSPHPSITASAITTMRVVLSTHAKGTRRMVPAMATTLARRGHYDSGED